MVTTMKKILLVALLVAATGATAKQRSFEKLDKDGSQTLSKAEFLIHIKPKSIERMTKVFGNRDKNHDGQLSREEYKIKGKKKS